ncbi:KptA family-domain-containing protein [Bisporella sp. PMI_857]|nr:KptA family-domain-containing protein [Bisporella sp. PMI_857]
MATAVLPAMQGLSLDQGIMPPSPAGQGSSRHGRRSSVAKGKGRSRGYSVVDERDVLISKAISWVLKRTVEEGEEVEGEGKLVANKGWVDVEEVLEQENLKSLEVTFPELQAVVASSASKSRFSLKISPDAESPESTDPSDYLIRANPTSATPAPASAATKQLTPLSLTTEDLPDLIVYETSYPNYPLILASGGIKRAGGQAHLQFASIKVLEDGTEARPASDADVSIFIDLRAVMEANLKITWSRTETGNVVTAGDEAGVLERKYWKKAVARRPDIGVLYENGEVRKEIPVGLRGKGAKGKGKLGGGKGKGREVRDQKAGSGDDDGTSSD